MKDIIVTITQVPWVEPLPRDIEAEWEETNRQVLLMAARGELLDSEGNPVSACTTCNGVTTYYAVDLFGELYEVTE